MNTNDIENLIRDLVEKVNIKINRVETEEENQKNIWFRVHVDEPDFFIQHNGEALQALNHLIHRMVESKTLRSSSDSQKLENSPRILIDINDFQKSRVESIRAVAHMMGERARYFKSNIEVDPMSSFERRIVHEFLADALDLKTESIGFGPARRVVIKYIGNIA